MLEYTEIGSGAIQKHWSYVGLDIGLHQPLPATYNPNVHNANFAAFNSSLPSIAGDQFFQWSDAPMNAYSWTYTDILAYGPNYLVGYNKTTGAINYVQLLSNGGITNYPMEAQNYG